MNCEDRARAALLRKPLEVEQARLRMARMGCRIWRRTPPGGHCRQDPAGDDRKDRLPGNQKKRLQVTLAMRASGRCGVMAGPRTQMTALLR